MEFLHRCIFFTDFPLLLINKSKIPVFSQEFHFGIDLGILILQFYSIIAHAKR